MDGGRIPIAREAAQHDTVLHHTVIEGEGAGADRMQAEIAPCGFGSLGRHHDARAIAELGDELGGRRLEGEAQGQRINNIHGGN